MSKKKKISANSDTSRISFINLLITLIISVIPVANVLFFIISCAAAKTKSKRNFAAAALVLTLLFTVAIVVALVFFGDNIVAWADNVLAEKQSV